MNDERAAVAIACIEGRLPIEDAQRLLEEILALELGTGGETVVREEGCALPPWLAGSEDVGALLESHQCASLLTAATRRLKSTLASQEMGSFSMTLAAPDVMALADYWIDGGRVGHAYGGFSLQTEEGRIDRRSINMISSGHTLASWFFDHPLPVVPTESSQEVGHPLFPMFRIDEEQQTLITAVPESGTVETPHGRYTDCLKVTRQVIPREQSSEDPSQMSETWDLWLARGVGIVRSEMNSSASSIPMALEDARVAPSDSYFPLSAGNRWRYRALWDDGFHREVWRVLGRKDNGEHWMSVGACTRWPDAGGD